MCDKITRSDDRPAARRYGGVQTDAGCAVIAPLLPPPHKGRGRPRTPPLRAVINAVFYLAQSGCQWRLLPKDFPPYTTGRGNAEPRCRAGNPRAARAAVRPSAHALTRPAAPTATGARAP